MAHIMFSGIVAREAEIDVVALVAVEPHAINRMCLAAITSDLSEDYSYIVYSKEIAISYCL